MGKPAQEVKHQTVKEERQAEAIERLQQAAIDQKDEIIALQEILTRIGDDLVTAGNDPDAIRGYWADYQSPTERGDG